MPALRGALAVLREIGWKFPVPGLNKRFADSSSKYKHETPANESLRDQIPDTLAGAACLSDWNYLTFQFSSKKPWSAMPPA